jgi:hypothetical protein
MLTTVALLDLIDFKWLMAAEGRRVHVERLQSDRGYAEDCLRSALQSRCEPLRHRATQLLELMS